jgi:multiple sugar transport system ATP-binding protein
MNLRTVALIDGGAALGSLFVPLTRSVLAAADGLDEIVLGLRPESFHRSERYGFGLELVVELVEELGADAYVYGRLPADGAADKPFVVRVDGRVPPALGETIYLDARADEVHVFHPRTGARLD